MWTSVKLFLVLTVTVIFQTSSASELGIKLSDEPVKEKKKKEKKPSASVDGASAKGNFVLQPSLNFGHHTGFKKVYSGYGHGYAYWGFIPGATLNLDYNVHDYAAVGIYYSVGFQNYNKTKVFYLGNAFGVRGTFHWWQLMDDKSEKELLSDKIDFNLHVHLGGFLLSEKDKVTGTKLKHAGFNAGGGLGFKYYFVKNFGIAIDVGYEEASWAKLGFAFKV